MQMNAPDRHPLTPGALVRLAEADYCYGLGALTLRLTVEPAGDLARLEWVELTGVEIHWDGRDGVTRTVLARVAGIRVGRRRRAAPGRNAS